MSKVLVITTSLRPNSNSDILATRLIAGAKEAGHKVERIGLKGKKIGFCTGCLLCQETHECIIKDDATWIAKKVKGADSLVFVLPIYYGDMPGQMKTLLDRLFPIHRTEYNFRRVYMLSTAEEEEEFIPEIAMDGLIGWTDTFFESNLIESLFCGGYVTPGEAKDRKDDLEAAFEFGKGIL